MANATTCKMTTSPSIGSQPSGPCTSNSFVGHITVPPNTGNSTTDYTITVTALGAGGSASGTFTFHVLPAPPAITGLAGSTPPPGGGSVTLSATLAHATRCSVASTPALSGTGTFGCTTSLGNGNPLTFEANKTTQPKTYVIKLVVTGPGGTVSKTLTLTQQPASH